MAAQMGQISSMDDRRHGWRLRAFVKSIETSRWEAREGSVSEEAETGFVHPLRKAVAHFALRNA